MADSVPRRILPVIVLSQFAGTSLCSAAATQATGYFLDAQGLRAVAVAMVAATLASMMMVFRYPRSHG